MSEIAAHRRSGSRRMRFMPAASPEARALPLIQWIYRAAVTPDAWTDFTFAAARELGDSAVVMNLEVPGTPAERLSYRVN